MRFATLLPITELILWAVLVPTQAMVAWLHLRQAAGADDSVRITAGEFTVVVPRNRIPYFAFETIGTRESHLVAAINAPGIFAELPISAVLSWPESWHPQGWTLDYWRSISLPFLCLPSWWFAGRGLDGLLGWRRPRWWTLLIGTLFCVGFLVSLVGIWSVSTPAEGAEGYWILWGMSFWAVAFSTFPLVWIRGAIRRRPVRIPQASATRDSGWKAGSGG